MSVVYKVGREEEFIAKLTSLAKSRGVENEEMLKGGIVSLLAFDLPDVTREPEFLSTCTILAFCNKDISMEEVIKRKLYYEGSAGGFYAVGIAPKERMALRYLSQEGYNGYSYGMRTKYAETSTYRAGLRYNKIVDKIHDIDFANIDFDSKEVLRAISKIKGRGKKEYLLDIDSVMHLCRANDKSETDFDENSIDEQDMYSFILYICQNILSIEVSEHYVDISKILRTKENMRQRQESTLYSKVYSSYTAPFYSSTAKLVLPSPIDALSQYERKNIQEFYTSSRMLTTNRIVLRNGMGLGTWEHLLTVMITANMDMFNMNESYVDFIYLDIPYIKHLYHVRYRKLCKRLLGRYPDEKFPSFSHIIAARHYFYKLPEMSKEDIRMTETLFQISVMGVYYEGYEQRGYFAQRVQEATNIELEGRPAARQWTGTVLLISTGMITRRCGFHLKEAAGEEVSYNLSGAYSTFFRECFYQSERCAVFKMSDKIKEYALVEPEYGDVMRNPLLRIAENPHNYDICFSFTAGSLFREYIVPVFCSDKAYFVLSPQQKYTKTIPLSNEFLKPSIVSGTY